MSYKYGFTFGSGDCRNFSGLTPTFVLFVTEGGTFLTPPAVSEIGTTTGLYYFTYTPSATYTIFFQADGGSSITDNSLRYVKGTLDPVASVDQNLGFQVDSYGTTAAATTVFGQVNRINQLWQADSTFSKTTGLWAQYAQGTSTLLFQKTLTNNSAVVTKL